MAPISLHDHPDFWSGGEPRHLGQSPEEKLNGQVPWLHCCEPGRRLFELTLESSVFGHRGTQVFGFFGTLWIRNGLRHTISTGGVQLPPKSVMWPWGHGRIPLAEI